jgi:hypothetical protein
LQHSDEETGSVWSSALQRSFPSKASIYFRLQEAVAAAAHEKDVLEGFRLSALVTRSSSGENDGRAAATPSESSASVSNAATVTDSLLTVFRTPLGSMPGLFLLVETTPEPRLDRGT